MTTQNLRGARTTVVNMLAKARAAIDRRANRLTWLKVSGQQRRGSCARPRISAGAGNADTLGVVEDLNKRYGTTVAIVARDSIGFDPRGIASEPAVTGHLTVTKCSHIEVRHHRSPWGGWSSDDATKAASR